MAEKELSSDQKAQRVYDEIETKLHDIQRRASEPYRNRDYIGKCFSCDKAWIVRQSRQNDPTIRCKASYSEHMPIMPHDVVECNSYSKAGEVDIWDLIKMHRIIDLGTPDKVMGFKHDGESTEG
jgi:hypothetical protein